MIGGKDNEVLFLYSGEQPGHDPVELPQSSVEARDVVPVAPALIELDDIGEQQTPPHRCQCAFDEAVGLAIRRRVEAGDATAREQIVHLADAHAGDMPLLETVEQRGARRRQAEVLSLRCADPCRSTVNGRAMTRDTPCCPWSIARAIPHAAYSSSSGTVSTWAATWKTLSAEV